MDAPYGNLAAAATRPTSRPIHLTRLKEMHATGEKIAAVSAYDATFAVTACRAGVECIVVGADLATSYQGNATQEDITLDALAYHVGNVAQGLRTAQISAWVICDLPASSYGVSREAAIRHASRLTIAGAQMLCMKIDFNFAAIASFLTERGIAVCGHAKGIPKSQCTRVVTAIEDSGARFLLLESMDEDAVLEIVKARPDCVTLGRHAGLKTSGQLLSMPSLLGLFNDDNPPTPATYLSRSKSVQGAFESYVADVKANLLSLG